MTKHTMTNQRCGIVARMVWILVTAASLAGCSEGQQFGSVVATTDLPAGTAVTIETESVQPAFMVLASAPVGADGKVRFDHLLPGEYRLVVLGPNATVLQSTPPFGVAALETTVQFMSAAPNPP